MKSALPVLIVVAAISALWMHNCGGPRASVRAARMERGVAIVTLHNAGRGEGDVQLDVRAFPADGGAPFAGSQRIDLRGGEDIEVPVEIKGAGPDARVEAEVEYPPR